MANFLSFSPSATLAAAMSSVRRAQELMAQFPPAPAGAPTATDGDDTAAAAAAGTNGATDSNGVSADGTVAAGAAADPDGACIPAAPTDPDPAADGSLPRKRKANAMEDGVDGAEDVDAQGNGSAGAMVVEQAQPSPSPSPSEDMDTSDDARAAGSAVLAQAHAVFPVATSAATAAFLDTIDLTAESPQRADEATAMDDAQKADAGDEPAAEENELVEEPPPVLQEAEPCTLYTSRGPPSAHALLAASPPPPLPSYAAMKADGLLARSWPFELDAFQQRSVEVLENRQHLLVAAHTSAGKTVVAEYAIAMVFRENEKRRQAQQLQAPGSAAHVDAALPPTPRRVIYTAPIKALSNQKYREFKEIFTSPFEEVGLLTGDVMLNPSAPLLIMTTEILRSMLYNGSETLAETDVVVFDEIHYMKDTERGIIWEESIIMLPPSIQCVFLSATLSNAQEFAEWIHEVKSTSRGADEQLAASAAAGAAAAAASASASASGAALAPAGASSVSRVSAAVHHRATCHVVYTNQRPIPLTHYMFLKGGQGIYQIKNDRKNAATAAAAAAAAAAGGTGAAMPVNNGGAIITANLLKIQAEMQRQEKAKAAEKAAFSNLIKGAANRSAAAHSSPSTHFTDKVQAQLAVHRAAKKAHVPDVVRLISLCVEKQWLPALFFSFSRRECEGMSLVAIGDKWKLDLTTREEKECIHMVWSRAMEGLDAEDRRLKPLLYMYPLLLRGFAVHHSGLLPLLKEVVEILFQEGLVRVLFCTETFAMGLNLPARSVVFSQLSKYDGRTTRYLQASEYIQMAGRAGRRGVDTKGIVIMMLDKSDIEAGADSAVVSSSSAASSGSSSSSGEPGGMIRHLLTGSTDPLQSKFRLTYNMILNLIRCSSTFDPAYILSQSFLHFQHKNPFKQRAAGRTAGAGAGAGPAAPLTTVSGKRARMGEGGISSLHAAGAQAAAQHSSALASVSELQEELAAVDAEIKALRLTPDEQSRIVDFQAEYQRLRVLQDELHAYTLRHPHRCLLPFLQSGRLVYVRQPPVAETNTTASADSKAAVEAVEWGWGIVIHWRKRHAPVRMEPTAADASSSAAGGSSGGTSIPAPARFHPAEYVVDVLLPVGVDASSGAESVYRWGEVVVPHARAGPTGPQSWENGEWNLQRAHSKELRRNNTSVPPPPYHVVNCSLSMLHSLSSVRLYLPPSLLLAQPQGVETRSALFTVLDRCTDNFAHRNLPKLGVDDFVRAAPPLDAADAGAGSSSSSEEGLRHARAEQRIQSVGASIASCEAILSASPVHEYSLTAVQSFLHLHASRSALRARLSSFSSSLSSTHLLSYRIELKTRLRILRRFKHLTAEGVITNKGRIAADIECADELLLTEFLYEGHWTNLSADELAAILTAWLDVEKSSASRLQIPTAPLQAAYAGVRELAQQLSVVSTECGLVLDSSRYVASFKSDLIPITYAWVSGAAQSFADLTAMSDLFEGTIIRLFRRLDEMFNQLIKAAQAIGERTLLERLQEGQRKMKRGIMFAGSLYV